MSTKVPRKKRPTPHRKGRRAERGVRPGDLLGLFEHQDRLLSLDEVIKLLGVASDQADGIEAALRELCHAGRLLRDRKGRFGLTRKLEVMQGRVIGHKDGFGFLRPDQGDDLYLSAREMRTAMHGDLVLARVTESRSDGRSAGAIVEILERHYQRIVGTLHKGRNSFYLVPDEQRINQEVLIDDTGGFELRGGQIADVELLQYPDQHRPALGKVVEILSDRRTPSVEVEIAIRKHQLPNLWPEEVLKEVRSLPGKVLGRDVTNRENLTELPLITIDGEDAKDFDDAVYCRDTPAGFELVVAIADVAHYVKPGTGLDQEACNRGTSVYLPDRVIPMLPGALSEQLCSLRPRQDRLAIACTIQTDRDGTLRGYRFSLAVIHSQARTTYTQVADLLAGGKHDLSAPVIQSLRSLHRLYGCLAKQRDLRGAIDFEGNEVKILLGQDGLISGMESRQRNDAHRLIEECMILANRCAADFLLEKKLPFLSRVHEPPDQQQVHSVREFIRELGLRLHGEEQPAPADFSHLLEQARERPDFPVIRTLLLRNMKRAVYAPGQGGHFGLALEAYAHFTSPIRRYPDLLVHRAISHGLRNRKPASYPYTFDEMELLGQHSSMTEKRADETLWDIEAWLKCEFMRDKVGETFAATISGAVSFGLFVTLNDWYVDGLVHVTSLPNDYYHLDPARHRLIGKRTGRAFKLGEQLTVKLMAVAPDERKIDFTLVR